MHPHATVTHVFGLSFGELVVVLLVAVIAIGPRQLPSMLRTAGQWTAKLRRLALNMRAQSGIDALLEQEGLDRDVRRLRALLGKRSWVDAFGTDADEMADDYDNYDDYEVIEASTRDNSLDNRNSQNSLSNRGDSDYATQSAHDGDLLALRREYPEEGVDAYGVEPEIIDPYQGALDNASENTSKITSEHITGADDTQTESAADEATGGEG